MMKEEKKSGERKRECGEKKGEKKGLPRNFLAPRQQAGNFTLLFPPSWIVFYFPIPAAEFN